MCLVAESPGQMGRTAVLEGGNLQKNNMSSVMGLFMHFTQDIELAASFSPAACTGTDMMVSV
jgi:hypothetical protein